MLPKYTGETSTLPLLKRRSTPWPRHAEKLIRDVTGKLFSFDMYSTYNRHPTYVFDGKRWSATDASPAIVSNRLDSCWVEAQWGPPDLPSFENFTHSLTCQGKDAARWLLYGVPGNISFWGTELIPLALGDKRELLAQYGDSYLSADQGRTWKKVALPEVSGPLARLPDGRWLLPGSQGLYLIEPKLRSWHEIGLAGQKIAQAGSTPDGRLWARSGDRLYLCPKNRNPHIWSSTVLPSGAQELIPFGSGSWAQVSEGELAWSQNLRDWQQISLMTDAFTPTENQQLGGGQLWRADHSHRLWRHPLQPRSTWVQVSVPAPVRTEYWQPLAWTDRGLMVPTFAGLFLLDPAGHWQPADQGLPPETVAHTLPDETAVPQVVAQTSTEGWLSWDEGRWRALSIPVLELGNSYWRLQGSQGNLLWRTEKGSDAQVYLSLDTGKSWLDIGMLPIGQLKFASPVPIVKNGDRLWAGTSQGLHFSSDLGRHWQREALKVAAVFFLSAEAGLEAELVAGTGDGLYRLHIGEWSAAACRGHWVTSWVCHPEGPVAMVCDNAVFIDDVGTQRQVTTPAGRSLQLSAVPGGWLHLETAQVSRLGPAGENLGVLSLPLARWTHAGENWVLGDLDCNLFYSPDSGRSWRAFKGLADQTGLCQDAEGPLGLRIIGTDLWILGPQSWYSLPLKSLGSARPSARAG
ncbi:MAG TPA: hypothetical protein V6D23_14325 [Candidatus Obscuribacterales bacterium]